MDFFLSSLFWASIVLMVFYVIIKVAEWVIAWWLIITVEKNNTKNANRRTKMTDQMLEKAIKIISVMIKHESDVEFLDEVFQDELNMTLDDVISFIKENQDD